MDNNVRKVARVSPCKTCNRPSSCPRLDWQKKAELAGDSSTIANFLTASGTDDPHQLVNPVEVDGKKVVWVALIDNNRGNETDENGIPIPGTSIATVSDLPIFNTDYITCELLPCKVNRDDVFWHSNGALEAWEKGSIVLSNELGSNEFLRLPLFDREGESSSAIFIYKGHLVPGV